MNKFLQVSCSLALGLCSLAALSPTAWAGSYNRSAATAYADQYWSSYNPNYPSFPSDCTNYASQVLNAGGFPQNVDYNLHTGMPQSTTDDSYWFYQGGVYSNSWSVAEDLRIHIAGYTPYTQMTHYYGLQGSGSYNPLSGGDLIAYNWNSPQDPCWSQGAGTACHWSVEITTGTDPKGLVGDLVDEHTSNRYHVFWTLEDYNPYAPTTDIYCYHITY
jgi:hypothetical protein